MVEILPTNKREREKDLLWFFDLALVLKAANGALEMLGAALILAVPPALVIRIVEFLTGGEIGQDADDPITSYIRDAAQTFTVHSHYLLALYLTLHGAIKLFLVIGIFAGKKIAYPLFMIALVLFGTYEAYRGFMRQELLLQIVAVLDFTLLVLTAYEYRRRYPILPSSHDTRGDYAAQ